MKGGRGVPSNVRKHKELLSSRKLSRDAEKGRGSLSAERMSGYISS